MAIAAEIDNKLEISSCYLNLGLVYSNISNFQKAIIFLEKAMSIKTEIGDKRGVAMCYGNLGNCYQSHPNTI